MKNVQYFLTLSSFLCLGLYLGGCKKFLTTAPDLRAEITSVKTVKELLGSAYPSAAYQPFTEFASDNMDFKEGFAASASGTQDQKFVFPYEFRDVPADPGTDDVSQTYWTACYAAIASANKALQFISTVKDGAELKKLSPYKGEALLARAYAHFMLVTLFAQPYNIGGSNDQQGVPYVEEVEDVGIKKYERQTVGEVYARIERDLKEGLPLIEDNAYSIPKYHFNREAAYTFATRFYLHKGDYAQVQVMATQAVGNPSLIADYLRPWNTRYKSYSYNEITTNYPRATEKTNFLIIAANSTYQRQIFVQRYGMSAKRLDYRTKLFQRLFSTGWEITPPIYGRNTVYNIPKVSEYFKLKALGAKTGYAYLMFPAITSEELLFNLAEAKLRLHDSVGCIKLLNDYADKRLVKGSGSVLLRQNGNGDTLTMDKAVSFFTNTSSNPSSNREDAPNDYKVLEEGEAKSLVNGLNDREKSLLKALLDLKQYEFFFEGLRWFDIIRLHLTVKHKTGANSELVLKHGDKMRVFQVPNTVTVSGLELSPR